MFDIVTATVLQDLEDPVPIFQTVGVDSDDAMARLEFTLVAMHVLALSRQVVKGVTQPSKMAMSFAAEVDQACAGRSALGVEYVGKACRDQLLDS